MLKLFKPSSFAFGYLAILASFGCSSDPVEPAPQAILIDKEVNYTIAAQDYSATEWDSLKVKIHMRITRYTAGIESGVLFDSVLDWRKVKEVPAIENALLIKKTITGLDPNTQSISCGYVIYLEGKVNFRPYTRTIAEGQTFRHGEEPVYLDIFF